MSKKTKWKAKHKKARKPDPEPTGRGAAIRPTPERAKHGLWVDPTGFTKSQRPTMDMASEVIDMLFQAGKITSSQEQAAIMFKAARAAYMKELPETSGYKSCLVGRAPDHDDGDGNPALIAAYRALEAKLDRQERTNVIDATDGNQPASLVILRSGLDKLRSKN